MYRLCFALDVRNAFVWSQSFALARLLCMTGLVLHCCWCGIMLRFCCFHAWSAYHVKQFYHHSTNVSMEAHCCMYHRSRSIRSGWRSSLLASIVSQAHRWLGLIHIANIARTQQYSLQIIHEFVVHHNSCPKTYLILCISASKMMFLVFLKHDICTQSVSLTWLHHWFFSEKDLPW